MEIHSSSFKAGAKIPAQYTCDGDNRSPPLTWTDIPKGTKSFALIVEDPDAPKGTYTHWVAFNIPADVKSLPPGAGNAPNGHLQGKNDFGQVEYGGPCPPASHGDHRYFFYLYALDKTLDVPQGASKAEVEQAMKNHIIDHAQMMGKYGR